MRLSRTRMLLAALSGLGLLALTPGLAGAASTNTTTWTLQSIPKSGPVPNAVACSSSTSCLAVGSIGAEVFHGSAWSAVAAPADAQDLLGAACPGPSNCLAVGYTETSSTGGAAAQAWQWNGSTWTDLPTYNPASDDNELLDIRCLSATECEAVGYHGSYPLAEVWNGTSWSDQPTTGAPAGELTSVACLSASKCEATGTTEPSSGDSGTLAMDLSGSAWGTQSTPALPKVGSYPQKGLVSISCTGTTCLAVGFDGYFVTPSDQGYDLVTETWNGKSWALAAKVGAGDHAGAGGTDAATVRCLSATDCTMVGNWYDNNEDPENTLAETWNGKSWALNVTPNPNSAAQYPGDSLQGLACTATACYGLGYQTDANEDQYPLAEKS